MGEEKSPQQEGPGEVPGVEKPQASPATDRGPDSHSMPTLSEQLKDRNERDYKASYEGLNKWVTKEFNELRSTVTQLAGTMTKLVELQQPSPAPEPQEKVSAGKSESKSALEQAIAQRQAEQYRDIMLERYEKETGLPLTQFKELVQPVPPAMKEDGTLDESGQVSVIESLVNSLRGIKDDTQKETTRLMTEGELPGSAPGAAGGDEQPDAYKEFLKLMELQADPEFDKLSKAEQDKIENRYVELMYDPVVQESHPARVRPTQNWNEMMDEMRDLTRRVKLVESKFGAQ
jgi:hypothetical protein